ncbi:MAG: hypothetical protein PHC94_07450 [Methylobacter sp.]|nr:hypothetical protein [Methylobacter sp.]
MNTSLITTWIDAQSFNYGYSSSEALNHLNAELGSNYKSSKINQWRTEHAIPPKVRDYMLFMSIPYVLHEIGVPLDDCYQSANKVINMLIK